MHSTSKGVALAFLAYILFSCCDACVKALGKSMSIYEIAFFITVASLSTFGFSRAESESWREIFRLKRPGLIFIRAGTGIAAGLLGTYSFITLPFAEAYSVLFLMPAFATMLSIPILGEKVGWRRWSAVAIGFAGVLLVVRPGFRELHLGHLTAAFAAVFSAGGLIALRMLGTTEKRISVLGVTYASAILFNAILMIPTFKWPRAEDFAVIGVGGVLAGFAQIAMLIATKLAPPNRTAPAQYSQILSAVALGAIFFGEYPDAIAIVGMVLVVLSGLITFLREEQLHGWSARTLWMRNRSVG